MEGILLGATSLFVFEYFKSWRSQKKYEEAYWGERRGRARVEKEMKRISNIQLNTSEGIFVQPIGEIDSCYRQCIGTPRQGLLVPSSRASLKLHTNISPEALMGLENFSHVWITFKFHLNTNTLKESKSFSSRSTFTAKITLPMLKKKMGVFATRSPHRPNPVGVTLAQIERIDKAKRTVYLNACDLVQGTPVLDIKPYVPAYDTVNYNSSFGGEGVRKVQIAEWIEDTVYTRNEVTIDDVCVEQVMKIQSKLRHYKNNADMFIKGIKETLAAEVRSKFQTDRRMLDTSSGHLVEVQTKGCGWGVQYVLCASIMRIYDAMRWIHLMDVLYSLFCECFVIIIQYSLLLLSLSPPSLLTQPA